MITDLTTLKFSNVNEIIFTNKTKKEEFLFIFVKSFYLEIAIFVFSKKTKILSISKFCKKITKIMAIGNVNQNVFDLILLDSTRTISIVKFTKKLNFKIISSKNLLSEFPRDKIYSILIAISNPPLICVLGTTGGIKLFLRIGKPRGKGEFRFFNKGTRTIQRLLICYFIINSENISGKLFVSIESIKFLPYSRFLVFYKYKKNGIVKKKIFSRIDKTSYLIIPIPKINTVKEKLIILSKGKLSIIDYHEKNKISEIFPFRKVGGKILQTSIISFCRFKGKSKVIFFFLNKYSDLFILNCVSSKFIKNYPLKIGYFDSLPGTIKTIKVLPNGFFYACCGTGKILFYRFISIKKKKNQRGGFIPHFRTKNLILVDELCLIPEISQITHENFLDKYLKRIVFFCGTKRHSSLRLLERVCNIISVFHRSLKYKPVGLYIIEIIDEGVQFFVSFKISTLSFGINKKIEELNHLRIISDLKTISIFYSKFLKGILQVTNKTLRFLKYKHHNKKICQWVPEKDIFILKSVQNIYSKSYIFLFLSNSRIILLEIINSDKFLELKSWNLEKFKTNLFILNFYVSVEKNKSKFLILGIKKERTVRVFHLQSDLSLLLIGIQVLSWSPESIIVLKEKRRVFFLIGLNNGLLIKLFFYAEKNKIVFLEFLNLSPYPLYFPESFNPFYFFAFGDKVWRVKNNLFNSFQTQLLSSKSFDFFESLGKFIFVLQEKKLKVLFYERNSQLYLSTSRFNFNFTIIKSCLVIKKNRNFILTINKDNSSVLCDHGMNLCSLIKEKNKNLVDISLEKKGFGSSVSILELTKNQKYKNSQNLNLKDLFLSSTSTGHCFFNSITKKKSFVSNNYIFLISRVFDSSYVYEKGVILSINETHSQNLSIISTSLKNSFKFSSIIGGRYSKVPKLNFLFEHSINYQCSNLKIGFLSKFYMGSRFIIFLEKEIKILEITKENFKITKVINIPTLTFRKIYPLGNILYFSEGFQELKTLVFINKEKLWERVILHHNFMMNDFYIFNPIHILTNDLVNNFYVYKNYKNRFDCLIKKESLRLNLLLKFTDAIKINLNSNLKFLNEVFFN